MQLANRGRLLLRTPCPVPFGTWIRSNSETILSLTCHVSGVRTSLGTSSLSFYIRNELIISNRYICLVLSFLDLNIKVIGSDIHTSVYDKRDDFGFPIVNFPWLSDDVPRLPSYGFYISQLVRCARCCTSVLDFHSKNLKITSKLLIQGYRYHKLRTHLESSLDHTPNFCRNLVIFCFKNMRDGDLFNKLRRVKDTPNFVSSGSKIVKRLRRRQYDPLIIERTIGLVFGHCTALYRPFLKHCTLTNNIWRALSKPPQRRQGPDLHPLWLLVGTLSAIRPELAFSRAEHSLPYSNVIIYIFAMYIIFIIYALPVSIFMTSPLGVAVGLLSI